MASWGRTSRVTVSMRADRSGAAPAAVTAMRLAIAAILFDVLMCVRLDARSHLHKPYDVAHAIRHRRERGDETGLFFGDGSLARLDYPLHGRGHFLMQRAPRPELTDLVHSPNHNMNAPGLAGNRHP